MEDPIEPLDEIALALRQAARCGLTELVIQKDGNCWNVIRRVEGCNTVTRSSYDLTGAVLNTLNAGLSGRSVREDALLQFGDAIARFKDALRRQNRER